jgi:hypothetical protein
LASVDYSSFELKAEVLMDFKNTFTSQPMFFVQDHEQDFAIIATTSDALLIKLSNQLEIDVDETYEIGDIRALLFQDDMFYVLASRYKGSIEISLLKIDKNEIEESQVPHFVIRWDSKL